MPELGLPSTYDYSTATSNRKKSILLVIGVTGIGRPFVGFPTLGAQTRDLTFTLPCSRDWSSIRGNHVRSSQCSLSLPVGTFPGLCRSRDWGAAMCTFLGMRPRILCDWCIPKEEEKTFSGLGDQSRHYPIHGIARNIYIYVYNLKSPPKGRPQLERETDWDTRAVLYRKTWTRQQCVECVCALRGTVHRVIDRSKRCYKFCLKL